jgi:hypothetical protein
MAIKIFKVIWFFSLLGVLAVFMYVYASLPETVVINENPQAVSLSKESLFYVALALIAVSNMLVFVISRTFPEQDYNFKAWFYGLVVCINLFFVIGLSFISLYNSGEKFDYARLGFIIYGSLVLLIVWSISWPVYRIVQKFFHKQLV